MGSTAWPSQVDPERKYAALIQSPRSGRWSFDDGRCEDVSNIEKSYGAAAGPVALQAERQALALSLSAPRAGLSELRRRTPGQSNAVQDRPSPVAPRVSLYGDFPQARQVVHSRFSPCRYRRTASLPERNRRGHEGDWARAGRMTRTPEAPRPVARLPTTSHPEALARAPRGLA